MIIIKKFTIYILFLCVLVSVLGCQNKQEWERADFYTPEIDETIIDGEIDGMLSLINANHVKVMGRVKKPTIKGINLRNVMSGFEVRAYGSSLYMQTTSNNNSNYINVYIDNEFSQKILIEKGNTVIKLVDNLGEQVKDIKVVKITEPTMFSDFTVTSIYGEESTRFLAPIYNKNLRFEIYGDSITTGYAINGGSEKTAELWDASKTYAALTAQRFNANISVVAHQGWAMAKSIWGTEQNYLSISQIYDKVSDTDKIAWDFKNNQADIILINLGSNDNINDEFITAYKKFIKNIRIKHPKAMIFCLYGMLEYKSESSILSVVDSLKEEINMLYAFKLPYGTGGGFGHPGIQINQEAANVLIQEINNKLKLVNYSPL